MYIELWPKYHVAKKLTDSVNQAGEFIYAEDLHLYQGIEECPARIELVSFCINDQGSVVMRVLTQKSLLRLILRTCHYVQSKMGDLYLQPYNRDVRERTYGI